MKQDKTLANQSASSTPPAYCETVCCTTGFGLSRGMIMLEFKGYQGSVEVSIGDGVLFGKITNINDLVTYEADTVAGLRKAFEDAVDDYIEMKVPVAS